MKKLLALFLLLSSMALGQVAASRGVTFTATGADVAINLTTSGVVFHKISWVTVGTVTTCTLAVDSSADGTSFTAGGVIAGTSCNTAPGGQFISIAAHTNYIRLNLTTLTGGGSLVVTYTGYVNPIPLGVAPSGSGAAGINGFNIGTNGVLNFTINSTPGDGATNNVNRFSSTGGTGAPIDDFPYAFNGSTWDRQYYCNKSAVISGNTAVTTQLVALQASQIIRVCGFIAVSAGATTLQFNYGTGSNCGTGTTALTGVMTMASGTPLSLGDGGPMGEVFRTASANALCFVNSAAVQISGVVTYQQY
jgi:hypothetical protein